MIGSIFKYEIDDTLQISTLRPHIFVKPLGICNRSQSMKLFLRKSDWIDVLKHFLHDQKIHKIIMLTMIVDLKI